MAKAIFVLCADWFVVCLVAFFYVTLWGLFKVVIMTEIDAKRLAEDLDGLLSYEYMANNIDTCAGDMSFLIDNLRRVDHNGQFTASAAKYLFAIDPVGYADAIRTLVAITIDKDREHRYLQSVLTTIYGDDCLSRADELSAADDNFRRIFKRLFPKPDSL